MSWDRRAPRWRDRAAEIHARWGCAPGQTWRAGRHTVICDDNARHADAGGECEVLVLDPAFDAWATVETFDSPGREAVLAMTDTFYIGATIRRLGAPTRMFIWDTVSTLSRPNWARQQSRLCLWYGRAGAYRSARYLMSRPAPGEFRVREGGDRGAEYWRDRRAGTAHTADADWLTLADVYRERLTGLYPAAAGPAKPVAWLAAMIANCTRGARVFDPYAGSGATMEACERVGRTALLVDRDPIMVACTLDRAERIGLDITEVS